MLMAFMSTLLVAILGYAAASAAGGIGGGLSMEEEELFGIFEVMGSLLEDPEWAKIHPFPCTDTPWPGIDCELLEQSSTFHITKIHVGPDVLSPPCKASAKFSDSILKLPYLKTLSLITCFTNSPVSLPESLFGHLPFLEHFSVVSNPGLAGEIPPSISNLKNLRILSLSQNNLAGQIPIQIGKLKNLQQLDLSQNSLTGQVPQQIGDLRSLAILDLSSNNLQGDLPGSIGRLNSLEKMDLSFNGFEGCLPSEFGELKMLALLDASHNSLTGQLADEFSGLQRLQYLIMDENPLNAAFPAFPGSLSKLAVMSFSGCGLKGPILTTFSNLTNLTALSLDNNGLTGRVPPEIGRLPHLDALNLSRNQFSGQLSFPQEFIYRLGLRLDIRENNGLCTRYPYPRTINRNSRLSTNPICSVFSNKTLSDRSSNDGGADNMRPPNVYRGVKNSSSGDLDKKMLSFFLGLLMFLHFSCTQQQILDSG